MDYLVHHIEALVFCSPKPITPDEIHACLKEMFEADVPLDDISQGLEILEKKYDADDFSFGLVKSGGGFQFLTKPAYQASISILLKQQSKKRLSNSAMETLAIIAYKQPVTKTDIEQIRGVNCDYAVNKLLEKELIEIKGKADTIGRPMLYGTNDKFMDYFGINSLKDLPTPKDFVQDDNAIGKEEDAEEEQEKDEK
ncbi:SMC-Scp complex subunit ScpB [Marinoscillum furvescens]|uniref:Segregation and condensation protein B n=1 Tax=Marinoscillum furvescens DSM 4134 TaxID=1122208 RepID=A0A3D9L4L8_MARFU|nr:SMC-Scp complex subunit ScpB [Marinoscillum furvescens]REE00522.1 segregation and condensation protein B [Marinoscillum furvescens DSM 4134]